MAVKVPPLEGSDGRRDALKLAIIGVATTPLKVPKLDLFQVPLVAVAVSDFWPYRSIFPVRHFKFLPLCKMVTMDRGLTYSCLISY